MLTPRERFSRIMAHQEADRVPLDLAGTSLTAIDPRVARGLGDLLGLHERTAWSVRSHRRTHLTGPRRSTSAAWADLIGSGDRPAPGRPDRHVDMWGIERAWTGQYWDIVALPAQGRDDRGPAPLPLARTGALVHRSPTAGLPRRGAPPVGRDRLRGGGRAPGLRRVRAGLLDVRLRRFPACAWPASRTSCAASSISFWTCRSALSSPTTRRSASTST